MRTRWTLVSCSFVVAIVLAAPTLLAQFQSPYPMARHGGNYMHNFYFPPAPSSTPWAPSWSPDGKWIAIAMHGSIWKVDHVNAEAWEVTYNDKYHSSPDWSPDGRWIIYTADDDGQTIQLEIVDVESGESWPLTDDEFIYTDPVFSPDGGRVAYVSTKSNGYFNVYIRPIENGRWAGDEVAVTYDNSYGKNRLYFGEWDMHMSPAWMPSDDELLIVSNRNVPLGSGNVLRVPAIARGIDEAQTVLAEQTLYRTRPDVSIDGKRFIYSSTVGAADQYSNLYVQPTAGGEPYKMTFFQNDAFHPRWSPDGEWIAFITNEGGLPRLALLETYGGALKTFPRLTQHWKRPVGVLMVQVRDSGPGEPTAARIHLTASDGKSYAPGAVYARVSQAGDHVFHTADGIFRVILPVGAGKIAAVKGFEYWPQEAEFEIREDETTEITLDLERMADMSLRGWYSASTHVHLNYGGNLHNTLENLMIMSAAEDQDLVLEEIANKDNRILDYQHFVPGGGAHPISTPDRILIVGQEYRPPFYGHVFFFRLENNLISPFTTGYEGTAIESLYPSNTDMFRKAKAQGAIGGYQHANFAPGDPLERDLGGAKGFMVDAALGTTDAIEWSMAGDGSFYPLYAVWNNGLRITGVGGEDSISNLHRSKLVGSVRTYVYTGDRGLDLDAWFEGLVEGRAFMSAGPLLDFTINGVMPGGTVELPAGGGQVTIRNGVRSITPLDSMKVIFNGEVVVEAPIDDVPSPVGKGEMYDLEVEMEVVESGWFHLRVEGTREQRYPLDTVFAQAFTNPVWVIVDGQPIRSREAAEYSMRWIDKLKQMAEAWPYWRSQAEKDHVYAQFEEARQVYERFAEEAGP